MPYIHLDPLLTVWISHNQDICKQHSVTCGISSAMPLKFEENRLFSDKMAGIVGIVGTISAIQHSVIPTSSHSDEYGCLIPVLSWEACHA